jgi:hypothetical protein
VEKNNLQNEVKMKNKFVPHKITFISTTLFEQHKHEVENNTEARKPMKILSVNSTKNSKNNGKISFGFRSTKTPHYILRYLGGADVFQALFSSRFTRTKVKSRGGRSRSALLREFDYKNDVTFMIRTYFR